MGSKGWQTASHRTFTPKKALVAGVVTLTVAMYGCAGLRQSMAENPGWSTTICAGGGALAGAMAGALIDKKDPLRGALIGLVGGATTAGAACFAVAKFSSTQVKDYQQTQQATGYRPSQGTVVRVDSFTVEPTTVSAGQKLTFGAEYYVMTPEREADLPVVERMIVSFYDEQTKEWKELGRTQSEVTMKPGTRQIPPSQINTPAKPLSQRYRVALQVEHDKVTDGKSQGIYMAPTQAVAVSDVAAAVVGLTADEAQLAKAH
jgi:hypothetical protein